jgi:hypothetical protein
MTKHKINDNMPLETHKSLTEWKETEKYNCSSYSHRRIKADPDISQALIVE